MSEPTERAIIELLADILYVEPDTIDPDASFVDLGLDSILAVEYVAQLRRELGVTESIQSLYDSGSPRVFLHRVLGAAAA